MPITDPSTFAGWFDDGKTLRAYLGDRSAHTDIAVRALAMVPNAGLVAGTTRTQAGATVLQPGYNLVATSTAPTNNLGDGVLLPPSTPAAPYITPQLVVVSNPTANQVQVYGTGTDTVNGQAAATGIVLPAGTIGIFLPIAGTGYIAPPASNPHPPVPHFPGPPSP